MKKLSPFALAATLAVFSLFPIAVHADDVAAAKPAVTAGKVIYSGTKRVGAVYRVTQAGVVQVIVEGHLVNIPAETISLVDGKFTTSLTTAELYAHN